MSVFTKYLIFCLLLTSSTLFAESHRFFFEGDGSVHLINAKTGLGGVITYRTPEGHYSDEAHTRINRLFGVPVGSSDETSLRLIALLDHLQDHLKGGPIRIVSGYRSPEYNDGLRKKGKLAAKTSLHIEGMAADIDMDGVDGKTLWNYVRGLNCCGAGYYHGTGIHVDVGPSRFWDEKTTGVEKNLGGHNKLLLTRTEFDRYQPGEVVRLHIGRITDYPLRVALPYKRDKNCQTITNHKDAQSLSVALPSDLQKDRVFSLAISLCERPFPEMPEHIDSNLIQISKD